MCVMIHALCSETRTLERPLLFEIRTTHQGAGYGLLVLHGYALACVPRCRPGPMLPLLGAVA